MPGYCRTGISLGPVLSPTNLPFFRQVSIVYSYAKNRLELSSDVKCARAHRPHHLFSSTALRRGTEEESHLVRIVSRQTELRRRDRVGLQLDSFC